MNTPQYHIVFISSWYPNRNYSTHGIFNRHLAKAAARYNKVSVLHVCSEDNLEKEELQKGEDPSLFELYLYYPKVKSKIPLQSIWLKHKRYLHAVERLFKQIRQERGEVDLIHCNVALPAGLGASHLSKKFNIPFVLNEGWTGYMEADGSYKGSINKWLTRRIVTRASRIMPVSEDLKLSMQSHGLHGNYTVLPNVIQTEIFVPSDKLYTGKIRFIHVSSFDHRQKNVIGILRAFHKALVQKPDMELCLVGEIGYNTELEKQVVQMDLQQQVHFLGSKTATELVDIFQNSTALMMFSNYESFGVVIGEALSCGLPVICSKAGGLSSSLTDQLAILLQKGNEEELCQAILKMAETHLQFDKIKLRKFILELFSEQTVAGQLNSVYREIVEKKHVE